MTKLINNKINLNFLVVILLLISTSGNIFSSIINYETYFTKINFQDLEKNSLNEFNFPYLDTECQYSMHQLNKLIHEIENQNNSNIEIRYYETPATLKCHDRPVNSSYFGKSVKPYSSALITVGVGVNNDLENLERMAKFLLIFLSLCLLFSKFKIKSNELIVHNKAIAIFLILNIFYCLLVFDTLKASISNFIIFMLFGNIIFLQISSFFSQKIVLQSIVAMAILPLMFLNSNTSFIWLLLLYGLNSFFNKDIVYDKKFLLINLILILSFVTNINNYFFEKSNEFFSWILFVSHRHQGSIVDLNNGLQSLVLLIDLLLIINIIYFLFIDNKRLKFHEKNFFDSLLIGFIIWFGGYLISNLNNIVNFEIYKLFGLSEQIDTITSLQGDGINWRGITSSHELTGFWLFLIASISLYLIFKTKNYLYFITLLLSLISLNWNSQRTALILFVAISTFLFVQNLKLKSLLFLFPFLIVINIVLPDAVERTSSRVSDLSISQEIDDKYKRELKNSLLRHENISSKVPLPDYNFNELTKWNEFYEIETGISSDLILNSIFILEQIFNRGVQWGRFLYFEDVDGLNLFGKGPGQSHQVLVQMIEKPHSLYLTTYYQYGWFGLLILFSLLLNNIFNLFKFKLSFYDILLLTFFVNGLKAEFLMTHNQIILFCLIVIFRNTSLDKRNVKKIEK